MINSIDTPPREQAPEDRQAYGGAGPESICRHLADDPQECRRRGHSASAHTLSELQEDILQRLGLGVTLYRQLEIQTIEV